jgi:hypothetical protein
MQLKPALVARDVRLSPITLVVALPSGSTAGDIESSMSGGPAPAHALDEACNAARGMNADKLVSCGYVFMDSGDEIAVGTDNSMQVSLGCEFDQYLRMYSERSTGLSAHEVHEHL